MTWVVSLLPIATVPTTPPRSSVSPICSMAIVPAPLSAFIDNPPRCSVSVPPIIPAISTAPPPDLMVRVPLALSASTVPSRLTAPPSLSLVSISIAAPNSSKAPSPPIVKLPSSSVEPEGV